MKLLSLLFPVILLLIFTSCKDSQETKNQTKSLELISSFKTDVPEPSGLTLSYDKKALWTVSDETNRAYLISFEGTIIDSLQLQGIDPEGITVINDTTITVIFERERSIAFYNTSGKEINKKIFPEFTGDLNMGFEGIAYNPVNGHYFIVNEMNPQLLIEIDSDLNIVKHTELNFANDFSGLYFGDDFNYLWVISHESKLVAKCDLNGNLIESYNVDIPQLEGIAIDYDTNLIYLICDISEELFVYKLHK